MGHCSYVMGYAESYGSIFRTLTKIPLIILRFLPICAGYRRFSNNLHEFFVPPRT